MSYAWRIALFQCLVNLVKTAASILWTCKLQYCKEQRCYNNLGIECRDDRLILGDKEDEKENLGWDSHLDMFNNGRAARR